MIRARKTKFVNSNTKFCLINMTFLSVSSLTFSFEFTLTLVPNISLLISLDVCVGRVVGG